MSQTRHFACVPKVALPLGQFSSKFFEMCEVGTKPELLKELEAR
jgi:hypothetical protein